MSTTVTYMCTTTTHESALIARIGEALASPILDAAQAAGDYTHGTYADTMARGSWLAEMYVETCGYSAGRALLDGLGGEVRDLVAA